MAPLTAAAGPCVDVAGFTNGKGLGCGDYVGNKWCKDGHVIKGARAERRECWPTLVAAKTRDLLAS